jgi:hypothetical protein
MESRVTIGGGVQTRVIRAPRAPLAWRVNNTLRWSYVWGWIVNTLARLFTALTGVPTIVAELRGRLVQRDGTVIDFGVLSRRLVTDAGVAFLVDDWADDSADITTLNYHGSGTGTGAEAVGDTALGTAVESRASGTKSQPAANQLRSVATISYTASRAITEHGLFSAATAGTLWDRSVFSAINVANGDSIQFTYTCTVNSGG